MLPLSFDVVEEPNGAGRYIILIHEAFQWSSKNMTDRFTNIKYSTPSLTNTFIIYIRLTTNTEIKTFSLSYLHEHQKKHQIHIEKRPQQ